ncbi:response regulator [Fusibacter bizertensis]|uniref:Stage 0 sporulation protein A homolog n=1 Tax=Fusibacter bizertensis TaxID=1488331 RepID=A0ABT6N9R5_9FIRM|nr:ATP-binding protein [Fusibacter bizertensis]MDH8677156.1 response regulator [Fusibacter bizertensis]
MRILIVEDSRINQFIARDTLVKYEIDCEIEFAMDGEEALQHIYGHSIDLVLLDIIMPKLTGLQVLEHLHTTKMKDIPKIIMLTTISDSKILKACFDLGASDYIKKPFEEMDFISRINSTFREIENDQKLKQNSQLLEEQNAKLVKVNESLKEAQYHLVQKEKLVAIGELAAGIAHEINNPLAFVISNFTNIRQYVDSFENFIKTIMSKIEDSSLSLEEFKKVAAELWEKSDMTFVFEDFPELITDSQKGLDRVAKIVNSMRNFARLSDENYFEYVDIIELLEEVFIVVNNEVKYIATLEKNLQQCPPIYCNKGQIEQVFVNLIINAAHAIKGYTYAGSGIIKVETIPEKEFCVIMVCDNGSGIDSEHLNKIFDPFFTTKPVGQGTGLGLSISHNIIVDKHQGKISVESNPGEGTCFKISIPYSHDEVVE